MSDIIVITDLESGEEFHISEGDFIDVLHNMTNDQIELLYTELGMQYTDVKKEIDNVLAPYGGWDAMDEDDWDPENLEPEDEAMFEYFWGIKSGIHRLIILLKNNMESARDDLFLVGYL